eukprot:UN16712
MAYPQADPGAIAKQFENGIKKITEHIKNAGATPVIASCYPCNFYEKRQYKQLLATNETMKSWKYPYIDLLTCTDDGKGH